MSSNLKRSVHEYLVLTCSCIAQVACALVMSGEKLDDHVDVQNILVDMGIYFQVQVSSTVQHTDVLVHISSTVVQEKRV